MRSLGYMNIVFFIDFGSMDFHLVEECIHMNHMITNMNSFYDFGSLDGSLN